MDYSLMADELLKKMTVLIRSHSHKKIGEFVEGEMFILKHLTFVTEKALPNELAAAMNTSSSRIAAILNSLERKGWITREIDEADRRRILVALTASGKQFVLEKQHMIHDIMENVLQRLGENDTHEVLRILDRFLSIYSDMMPEKKACCLKDTGVGMQNRADTLNKGESKQ
jgi:MarR family transcriptional regulator, organic hydroperoxide resistance regulator